MSGAAKLSSVAYKKGNWMRYTLWGVAALCISVLFFTFFSTITNEISAAVPEGYKFSVTDHYNEGSNIRTTYYIYENKIFVEDESFESDSVNRATLIYDGVNTHDLILDENDTAELCELGVCHSAPKVLITIKKLIANKPGREYIGL